MARRFRAVGSDALGLVRSSSSAAQSDCPGFTVCWGHHRPRPTFPFCAPGASARGAPVPLRLLAIPAIPGANSRVRRRRSKASPIVDFPPSRPSSLELRSPKRTHANVDAVTQRRAYDSESGLAPPSPRKKLVVVAALAGSSQIGT